MALGESIAGQAVAHRSDSGSLEEDWIDLGSPTTELDNEAFGYKSSGSRHSCYELLQYEEKTSLQSCSEGEPERTAQDDIIRLWEGLFDIADALSNVHETKPLEPLHGRNPDVKLGNIVRVNSMESAEQWSTKLAGISVAKLRRPSFTKSTLGQSHGYGTSSYGAPELNPQRGAAYPRAKSTVDDVDLWSLGCVFCEAAAWLVLGFSNLSEPTTPDRDLQSSVDAAPRSKLGFRRKRLITECDSVQIAEIRRPCSSQGAQNLLLMSGSCKRLPTMTNFVKWNTIKQMLEMTVKEIDRWHDISDEVLSNSNSYKRSKRILRHTDMNRISPNTNLQSNVNNDPNSEDHESENDSMNLGLKTNGHCKTRIEFLNSKPNLQSDSWRTFQETQAVLDWIHTASLTKASLGDPSVCGSWSHCFSRLSQQTEVALNSEVTGQWLLEDDNFVHWQNRRDGIFWLCGSAGSGKSTLTSTVLDKFQSRRSTGEYIVNIRVDPYFRRSSTAAMILWEILVQMRLSKSADYPQAGLHAVLADLVHAGDKISPAQVKSIFSRIRHSLKDDEILYLFVDDLTGHDNELERDLLYDFIEHVGRSDPKHRVKVFISSRPNFFGGRYFTGSSRVDIDNHPKAKQELAVYVKTALRIRSWNHVSELFVKKILDQSGVSFLEARLILQSAELPSGSESALEVTEDRVSRFFPTDLSTLYGNVLERLERCSRKVAKAAFSWLAYAARPLHSTEMVGALKMQTGTELKTADILNVCGSLVVIDENQIVRFAHYTVREFLESSINGRRSEISVADGNEMIADTCLKTIYPQTLLRSLRLPEDCSDRSTSEIDCGYRQSLISYARRYWLFHYKLAEPGSFYIAGLLHKFMRTCMSSFNIINTALTVGARFGFSKLVRLELEMGADMNLASGSENRTPLMWATMSGHMDTVKLLLEYGADPWITSSSGDTPLMVAAANGHLEIVKLLFESRAQSHLGSAASHSLLPSESVTQEISLKTVFLTPCTTCGAVESAYRLSVAPRIGEEFQESGAAMSPAITIRGDYISPAEMELLKLNSYSSTSGASDHKPKITGQKRRIKWFPGARMHRSLEIAAKRGIEDIRTLLLAVGNDSHDLGTAISVSKLVAKIRIS